MQIIEGQIPEGPEWRDIVALRPGQALGITWQLGRRLARANRGQLILAYIVPDEDDDQLSEAREILEAAQAMAAANNQTQFQGLIIQSNDFVAALSELVELVGADLVLLIVDRPGEYDFRTIPCAIGMTRNVPPTSVERRTPEAMALDNIIVATSGGPNSAFALGLLMPLAPDVKLTALYVATTQLGESEEALGRSRLRQTLDYIDAGDRIETHVVTAHSVTKGVVDEAGEHCDLVVIGASEESRVDQLLFGNVPEKIIQELHRPVMVMRSNRDAFRSLIGALDWRIRAFVPRKTVRERAEIYARIRRSARPEQAFYVMMALSTIIAALGLISGSTAVVIGAMLVAPLMSPIIGTGLAMVMGDTRFLRLTLGAVNRGVLVAIGVSFVVGILSSGQPFTDEILARTQPNLVDLAIAVFSGLAAAYALSFSSAAGALPGVAIAAALVPPLAVVGIALGSGVVALLGGQPEAGFSDLADSFGALLLFSTNFIAIGTAAALVFFVLGFRPTPSQKARQEVQQKSARVALGLLAGLALVLGLTSYLLARESAREAHIHAITAQQVEEVTGAIVVESRIIDDSGGILSLAIVARSSTPIYHSTVVALQESMAAEFSQQGLADELALTMSVIEVTELDPLTPPLSEAAVP